MDALRSLALAGMLLLGSTAGAAAVDISVSGTVVDVNGSDPVSMIKVSAYRDLQLVDKVYTDDAGHYVLDIPGGEPVTLLFDTHPTLNNARDWHPSVLANLAADKDFIVDRKLLSTQDGAGEAATIDALTAYEYGLMWNDALPAEGYAKMAAARLGQLKITNEALRDLQQQLIEHFGK